MGNIRIYPPVYLLQATESCWRCGVSAQVVALACKRVEERNEGSTTYEDITEANEPAILSAPTELPHDLLKQIQQVQPNFARRTSHTAGVEYYANFCPACSALFGDFYLHSEPGGAFFPMRDEDAKAIDLRKLDATKPLELSASPHWGLGGVIFEHGRRL